MRFIYNPFSQSSSKLQVSNESLQWLLKDLPASSLTVKFLQVTVTDHKMVGSQQALKNVHVQGRIMVMEWERQKVELSSVGLQVKPTVPAFRSDIPPLILLPFNITWTLNMTRVPFYLHLFLLNLSPPVAMEKHCTKPFSGQWPQFDDHFSILYIHVTLFGYADAMLAKNHQSSNSRENQIKDKDCGTQSRGHRIKCSVPAWPGNFIHAYVPEITACVQMSTCRHMHSSQKVGTIQMPTSGGMDKTSYDTICTT